MTTRRKLSACINESVGFLFTITPNKAIEKPRIVVNRKGASAGSDSISVELARAHRVHVDRFPGWHIRAIPPSLRERDPFDALVPLEAPKGGMPARFQRGEEHAFWVELTAAKGTVAGIHRVPIELQSAGKPMGSLEVEFTVWPMVLPDRGDVGIIGELDPSSLIQYHAPSAGVKAAGGTGWHDLPANGDSIRLVNLTMQLLQAHRVTPVLSGVNPKVKVSARGELEIDWSDYDQIVAPFLSGQAFVDRVALPVWPLPLDAVMRSTGTGSLAAPGSQALAKRYIEECARHFQEQGWLDRSFVLVDAPDGATSESMTVAQQTAELIRAARKDIRIASRRFPQDMRPFGWFDFAKSEQSDVDIWITDAQFYDPRTMSAQRGLGRRTWLAVDRPPFSGSTALCARPGDVLSLSWEAELLDAEYLWLGRINNWPAEVSPADPTTCARFDSTALLYPGVVFGINEPVPTLRLKRLRETMQYAAYVKLLAQHGRGHITHALCSSLVEYAGSDAYRTHFSDGRPIGWPDKPDLFESARRIMAQDMLNLAARPVEPDGGSDIASTLLWRAFMMTTRGIRTRVDGTRVRMTGTPLHPRVQIDIWCTVSNQSRSPVQARVSLQGVPSECTTVDDGRQIELLVGKSERLGLSLDCGAALLQTGRRIEPVIELSELNQAPITTPVRLSMLVAEPTARPLIIDGDLSDWTAAAGNATGDFVLIAGECESDEPPRARPSLRTIAFTRRDAENLYVGINAEALADTGPRVRRRSVFYDDSIPMDEEDLVEILIDPLNGGTRSPADLYHIVIKRSGVYLIERGISTVPPLGPYRPWQADIDVASRAQSNRWTAEVRIPLSSFDRPGTVRGEVWGLNVTHYNAKEQEFSTWSGAVGNAYDPISLGNLLLP